MEGVSSITPQNKKNKMYFIPDKEYFTTIIFIDSLKN